MTQSNITSVSGLQVLPSQSDTSQGQGAIYLGGLTQSQRDALPLTTGPLSTVAGISIYNLTTNVFNFYQNGAWTTFINFGGVNADVQQDQVAIFNVTGSGASISNSTVTADVNGNLTVPGTLTAHVLPAAVSEAFINNNIAVNAGGAFYTNGANTNNGYSFQSDEGGIFINAEALSVFGGAVNINQELSVSGICNLHGDGRTSTMTIDEGGVTINDSVTINADLVINIGDLEIAGNVQETIDEYAFLANETTYVGFGGDGGAFHPYAIRVGINRIQANQFCATSSKKIKNILVEDIDIINEATDLFKKIPFSKYKYKDTKAHGNGTYYGLIAEELAEIIPAFVDQNHKQYVPNVMQMVSSIIKIGDHYQLGFEQALTKKLEGDKVKILTTGNFIEAELISHNDYEIVISCEQKLVDNRLFIYGTYENCPTISKMDVAELAMVALQGQITKVEELTKRIEQLEANK